MDNGDDPLNLLRLARQADPDYPQALTYPTETFASNAELRIAGLTPQTAQTSVPVSPPRRQLISSRRRVRCSAGT